MKTEELLKVLDMGEEEWKEWLISQNIQKHCKGTGNLQGIVLPSESLADLAFRLRDEAGQGKFSENIVEVFEYLYDYSSYKDVFLWMSSKECKPIHWIIAALIAKEMQDGEA